ncbi:MAG: Ni/Fe hydrogenase subunit alpha [Porticoccaceae bacterium]|nr:MAG: Ni/Fe hydrogenase subunit alpha [Porticoccaceae bacterium]
MSGETTIRVDYLARVEGEGALHVRYDQNGVREVRLEIFEPPRFFEALLRGRNALEAPDITARICGICPVAYQMSAVHAVEAALEVQVPEEIRRLRRLLYCGEWIESHVLHVAMLHAPDFFELPSAVELARLQPAVVRDALALKKAGNAIVALLGGREIHPINVRVGGFWRLPRAGELAELARSLPAARERAEALVHFAASLEPPPFPRPKPYLFVALRHEEEYPMCGGVLSTSDGRSFDPGQFEDHFLEHQVPHSNALHCLLEGREPYLVGPLARFHLNFAKLAPTARALAEAVGARPPRPNPFGSILVRALEVLHAVETAQEILADYRQPAVAAVPLAAKAGRGAAITEAPRGILYHRYDLDEKGRILEAKIVPPTSQNQRTIEEDLRFLLDGLLGEDSDLVRRRCEQAIRNHDPCISCATHFLRLDLERVEEVP